jgi:hypothetical protein
MKTWAWSAMAVSTLAAASCSSSTGGTTCGTFQLSTDPTCEACVEGSCCAELAACDKGTPCNGLFTCLDGCAGSDMACQTTCVTSQSGGVSDAQALLGCYDSHCKSEMACSPGAICMSGASTPVQACADCDTANCCAEWTACAMDTTCSSCLAPDPDSGCQTNALLVAAQACADSKCGSQCNAGKICDSGLIDTTRPACGECDGMKCCVEFDACVQDSACLGCITGMTATGCGTNAKLMAVDACQMTNCATPCM